MARQASIRVDHRRVSTCHCNHSESWNSILQASHCKSQAPHHMHVFGRDFVPKPQKQHKSPRSLLGHVHDSSMVYLSSMMKELKRNLWDSRGIVVWLYYPPPPKSERSPSLLPSWSRGHKVPRISALSPANSSCMPLA